jgi:HAD superfamily hydrolase (TIGR01549 family)
MIRAVLFDLDDTLVDHHFASRAALAGVRERFTALKSRELDELARENQRILDSMHEEVALGRRDVADARIERYRRLFAFVGEAPTRAAAAAELHRRTYQANRRCVEGALELVTHLKSRLRVVVVTNNTTAEQTEKLATFGFAPLVDALVTSEDVGAAKPDRRMFDAALQRVACEPHEAVMIGDAWVHDVLGATSAGIRALWLNRHGVAHPDPSVAMQILSLCPAESVAALVAPDHVLLNLGPLPPSSLHVLPGSRSTMWCASTRASPTMCSAAMPTRARRAYGIPRSTAASTGTRACTCTGCSRA